MKRIHELIATDRDDAIAVVDSDRRVFTYHALAAVASDIEKQLRRYGIRPGDRVILLAENCVTYIATVLAISRMDAIVIPVNARMTVVEIDRIADHADARCLLIVPDGSPDARAHAKFFNAWSIGALSSGTLLASHIRDVPEEHVVHDADDTAVLIYTSGTTGNPKGVMLTHRNLLFSIPNGARLRALAPQDVILGLLPCTHIFGLTSVILAPLSIGAKLILMPRFDVDTTLQHIRNGVTVLPAVPQIYNAILARLQELDTPFQHRLRFVYAGGAPMLPSVKQKVEEALGVPLHNGYGLTEAAPSVAATRADAPRSDGSVGPALDGVEVVIDNPNNEGIGEILVRGPNITKGYFRDPVATQAALTKNGFLRTGDLGKLGADDELYIMGRLKELIIHSGFNVYPPEIETTLASHPSVDLAAVVGKMREANEDVIAFVTTHQNVSEDDLRTWCRERLTAYKVPARVIVLDSMPQAATGKILKNRLLANFHDRLEDAGNLGSCANG